MSIDKKETNEDLTEFFGDSFEVTYDGDVNTAQSELEAVQTDLKDDAYKDALSALSELDDTHSFDYLEMNKTKTINLNEYLAEQKEREALAAQETHEESPLKKLFHSIIPGRK